MSAKRYVTAAERLEWLQAVALSDARRQSLRVAACLADHCNSKTGQCNPGRERIAQLTGMRTIRVSEALRELKEMGFILEAKSQTRAKQWDLVNLHERYATAYPNGTLQRTPKVRYSVPRTKEENLIKEHPPKPPRENGPVPGSETDHPRASLAPLQGGVVEGSSKKSGRRRRHRSKLQMSDERLEHLSGLRERMMDDDG